MKRIVVDTNVFVRHFIRDIPSQFQEVEHFLKKIEKGETIALVSVLVVNELIWVLENYYKIHRNEYMPEFVKLLSLSNLKLIEAKKELLLEVLLNLQKRNIDFTDMYLFHIAKGGPIFSFDKDLKKLRPAS